VVIRVNAHVVYRHGLSLFVAMVFGDTFKNNKASTMPYLFEKIGTTGMLKTDLE
jgi:hypothetical protein